METMFALIDSTTPQDAMTYTSTEDGQAWQLVFSDEFNTDGRSFYPGGEAFQRHRRFLFSQGIPLPR